MDEKVIFFKGDYHEAETLLLNINTKKVESLDYFEKSSNKVYGEGSIKEIYFIDKDNLLYLKYINDYSDSILMYNNKNSKHTILIKNSGTDFIYFRDFNIFLYEQEEYINNLIDINYLYYFDLNSNQKFIIDKSIGISPIIFFRSFKNILAFNKDKYLLKDIFSNNFYLIEKNKIKKIKLDKDLVLIKYFSNNNLLIASKTNYADDSIKLFYYNIK